MKRLLCLLAFPAFVLGPRAVVHAQTPAPLGSVAATFPFTSAKVLADPARNRVYALETSINAVVVIDTTTYQTTTIPVGSQPVDMSLSPDDNTLYTANSATTLAAVTAINLNTLAVRASYGLPALPNGVTAGPQGRVYVTPANSYYTTYQLDTATGTVTTPFPGTVHGPGVLAPDGTTLYVTTNNSPVQTYDVSTPTPVLLRTGPLNYGSLPAISQTGRFLLGPLPARLSGYDPTPPYYATPLYSAADLTSIYGSLVNTSPYNLAFSPDDSLVYSVTNTVVDVFSTQTFAVVQEASLPTTFDGTYPMPYVGAAPSVVDRTGSYLFVRGTSNVVAVATGMGPLAPSSILPTITSPTAVVPGAVGVPFAYQIVATQAPTSYGISSVSVPLPPGLTLDPATGLISGTPTTAGYFSPINITATNASGTVAGALTISIGPVPEPTALSAFTSADTATATVGQPFSFQLTASNSPTSFYADTDGLPPGLTLDPATGIISGTPRVGGTFPVVLVVSNYVGTSGGSLTLTVNYPPPSVVVMAPVPRVTPLSGGTGEFVLQRTGDVSQPLFVSYTLSGNTHNGIDYRLLSGTVKIKAGRDSATVEIVPKGTRYSIPRTVRLTLQPADAYQLGGTTHARVTIEAVDPE